MKRTYLYCAFVTPLIVYLITRWDSLLESVRPDQYSAGSFYYAILFAVMMLSNAVIVRISQGRIPRYTFLKMWSIGNIISLITVFALIGIFSLIYMLMMSFGHWNFG